MSRAGKAQARLGDRTFGTCYHPSHVPLQIGGTIITASTTRFLDSTDKGAARQGDLVKSDCGHISEIITWDNTDITDERSGDARLGDQVGNGPYIARIITASTTVYDNES